MQRNGSEKRGERKRGLSVVVEIVVPLLIIAALADSASFTQWSSYAGRDPEIYGAVARLWEIGQMPYRDVYDFKPPLVYAVMRVGFVLWDYSCESFRRMLVILTGAAALCLYGGARCAGYSVLAPVASLALVTLLIAQPCPLGFQSPEFLAALFGAAGFGFATAYQRRRYWLMVVATGACAALAALGKQPGALFAVPLGLQLVLWGFKGNLRRWPLYVLRQALLFVAGVVLVVGATALYFAWKGALYALYEAVILDGATYSGVRFGAMLQPEFWLHVAQRPTAKLLPHWIIHPTMGPFVAGLAVLLPLTLFRPSRWVAVAWCWLVAGYLAVVIGPRAEPHYLITGFASLAVVVGIVCEAVFAPKPRDGSGGTRIRLASGIVLSALLFAGAWIEYLPKRHNVPVGPAEEQAMRIAERIREAAEPGDTIFVEDQPFSILIYAGLPSATRFIYYNSPHPNVTAARRAALLTLPPFLFVTHRTRARVQSVGSDETNPDYVFWAEFLRDNYEEWLSEDIGFVYRPKRRPPAGT